MVYDRGPCRGPPRFAVDWPTTPPPGGVLNGTQIVTGGSGAGDRPAYLELPDGTLDLLPQPPGAWRQWNFGYGCFGPDGLTNAIGRTMTLADGIDRERVPYRWLSEQVRRSDGRLLHIAVPDIRSRYRPADG